MPYEMFNDIIRNKQIKFVTFRFRDVRPVRLQDLAASYVVMVRPRRDANFIVRCKTGLATDPKRP